MSVVITSRCANEEKKAQHFVDWKIGALLPPAVGEKTQPGLAGAIAGVHQNVLIVAGGANFPDSMPWLGGKKKYHDDVYVFKKDKEDSLLFLNVFHLPFNLAYSAACTTPKGVVFAGGENENGLSKKAGILKWNGDSIEIKNLPDLPSQITNASIGTNENIVYVAGGENLEEASNQFLFLDLNDTTKGWQTLPSLPQPTSHAVMVAADHSVYLIGGRKKNKNGISDLYQSVYEYNSKDAKWKSKKSLPYALSAGTGTLIDGQTFLLFGGDRGETFHKTETLIAAINNEKDAVKKEELNRTKIALQTSHPGFSKEVLAYDIKKDEWRSVDAIPFAVPVTTTAFRWDDKVIIASGEIKAGVRTPEILVGKIKTE